MIDEIVEMYQNKVPSRVISEKTGLSVPNISYHLRKRGVIRPSNHLAKSVVKEIKTMVDTGMTIIDISERLNIPYNTIYSACYSRGWIKDVTQTRNWEDYAKDLGALAEYQRILDESPKVVAEKKKVKKVEYLGKKYLDLTDLYT